jgi:hypothetical protein
MEDVLKSVAVSLVPPLTNRPSQTDINEKRKMKEMTTTSTLQTKSFLPFLLITDKNIPAKIGIKVVEIYGCFKNHEKTTKNAKTKRYSRLFPLFSSRSSLDQSQTSIEVRSPKRIAKNSVRKVWK